MRDKVRELGQITGEDINSWGSKYIKKGDLYFCPNCGCTIMQKTCFVSIHDAGFGICAGGGEVEKINYPYCPKCGGEFDYARACYHTYIGLKEELKRKEVPINVTR